MKNNPKTMRDIYLGEYGDLFKSKPKKQPKNGESRLIESFEEINEFYQMNGFTPRKDSNNFKEQSLSRRLLNLRNAPEKRSLLKDRDKFNLLKLEEAPKSIGEIYSDNNDMFASDIFDVSKLPRFKRKIENKSTPQGRELSKDFEHKYRLLFEEQQRLLKLGLRRLKPFISEKQLRQGGFYIYGGMMCYVEYIDTDRIRMKGGHIQERTLTIFENGTESRMFRRSLRQRLMEESGFEIIDGEETTPAGYIYVLKSKSGKDEVKTIKDLYKIGFTAGTVEERIKNAEGDPTFLMAPVEIVSIYRVSSGVNAQKVEHILHTFLRSAKIEMTIIDNRGLKYTPTEWYSVSEKIVEQAVELLSNGQISNYYYNSHSRTIEKR